MRTLGDTMIQSIEQYCPQTVGQEKIEEILSNVEEIYDISLNELKGEKRTAEIARARQVAMYNLRMVTELSLKEIGRHLGGRTPATVSHGYQKIAKEKEMERRGEKRKGKKGRKKVR